MGDTLVGKRRVTGKHAENGKRVIDLLVRIEDLKGATSTAANAIVRICFRNWR